jgi:tetratricopeptide (TPR) repeat protein
MKQCQAIFEDAEATLTVFDTAIERLLIGILAFMPLAFGVVHAWSEEIVIALSGAIVLCFLLKLIFHNNQHLTWNWAYVPVGIFLLIAVFQLAPLPANLISIVSPNTAALKTELLGDLPNADAELRSMTLSFYPYATKHDLRLVLAVAGVFVVVINIFRRPNQIKCLLMAIAVIGGIIALIALAQNLLGNGKIYWLISSKNTKGQSGPFVNHSNYAQFMNLSIGAALGLVMVELHEAFGGKKITPSAVFKYLSCSSAKNLWLLLAVMCLGATTVFMSLSRGGMVSMLIAISFTTLLVASQQSLKSHTWLIVLIALITFTLLLHTGFDTVYDRLATLRDFDKAQSSRWQILKDIGVIWTKFPIFGTGLGTHFAVYPMFDRSTLIESARHAENEYAQALEETGLAGLGLLTIFGIMIWSSYARNIRNANLPICSAAYGLGFGILAILIHSLSDFGQHLPANAFLSAIACALMVSLAQRQKNASQLHKRTRTQNYRTLFACGVSILFAVVGVWALVGANNARIAETHWKKVLDMEKSFVNRNWQGTGAAYRDLISNAAIASSYEPENVEYRHWLNVYRWRAISQTTDPNTGDTIISENVIPAVRDIVEQFHKACTVCPTHGPSYSMAGQIEKLILHNDHGTERIRKGFRLSPCDPIACLVAAQLDVWEGKVDESVEKFERVVRLDDRFFKDVVNIYINKISRPHLAIALAGDDIGRLSYVCNVLEDMQYNDLAEQTRDKIRCLLEAKISEPKAPAAAFVSLGYIYGKQQNKDVAIEYYRRGLALDYGQVQWRYELAKLLVETGRIPEAIHEARICLRVQPQFKPAEALLADLSIRTATLGDENKSP